MESVTFEEDINIMYVEAKNFPEGIMDAHNELHKKVNEKLLASQRGVLSTVSENRKYFGISRPENGVIRYKAGAEEVEAGEAVRLGMKSMILKHGKYIATTLKNYLRDPSAIRRVFDKLLMDPRIDLEGYCVEWYLNDSDVRCLVRLKENF
jgi:hypothetical protein